MQTHTVPFTCENTYQSDSGGWRERERERERSRTLKALATFHVSQPATCVKLLHPRRTFHTFLKNVCFFTRSREWVQSCIVCVSAALCRSLYKTTSSCAIRSLPSHQFFCSPIESSSQWVFMSSWADHKESLPVLSFPQWQWESWPRAWALAVALTKTYASLLPVINDYISFGNKDIRGCQGSGSISMSME